MKKGISLVALVITIIVLIILTVAVIVMFNQGGIIGKAEEAVFKSDFKNILESYVSNKTNIMLENAENGNYNDINYIEARGEQLKQYISIINEQNIDKKEIKGKNYLSLIQIYEGKIYQEDNINDEEIERWLEEIGIPKLNDVPQNVEVIDNSGLWIVDEIDGEYVITGYRGTGEQLKNVIVPNVIEENGEKKNISKFGKNTYPYIKNEENNLVYFEGKLKISDGLKYTYTLWGNNKIEEVTFGNNCTLMLGTTIFGNATNLKNVKFGDNCSIGYGNFKNQSNSGDYSNIENIEIGKNCRIGAYAFERCKAQNIVIKGVLNSVGEHAFYQSNLKGNVIINKNITIGSDAFSSCSNIAEIEIGDNVVIGNNAFRNCTNVSKVTLGDNIDVGDSAFLGTRTIYVINGYLKNIGNDGFMDAGGVTDVKLKDGANIGGGGLYYCQVTNLEIGNNTTIGRSAIFGSGIFTLIGGDYITLESGALTYNRLTVILGDHCEIKTSGLGGGLVGNLTLGDYAIIASDTLPMVNGDSLPRNITIGKYATISDKAFKCPYSNESYKSLKEVTIGQDAISVGKDIFNGYTSLEKVTVYWKDGVRPNNWDENWLGDLTPQLIVNSY